MCEYTCTMVHSFLELTLSSHCGVWGLNSACQAHTHSKHFYPLCHRASPDWTLWELKSTMTISTQPATCAKELLQLCPPLSPHPVSCVSLAEWLLLKQGPIQSEVQLIWFIFWNCEHVIYNWNVLSGKKEYLGLLQHEEGLFLPVGCRNRQPCFSLRAKSGCYWLASGFDLRDALGRKSWPEYTMAASVCVLEDPWMGWLKDRLHP